MKRNKWLHYLLVMGLMVGVFLCSVPAMTEAARVEIRVDAGPPGGGKNFSNQAITEAIRKGNPGWDVTAITGPVSTVILGMMKRGALEVTTKAAVALYTLKEGRFGDRQLKMGPIELRWVFPVNFYILGFYVVDSVPADSIDELLAKKYPIKISVGQPGSEPYILANDVLNAFGVTFDDLKSWGGKVHHQPSSRSVKMVRDGHIEGKFHVGVVPEPAWEDLSRTRKLKILTLKSEAVKKKLIAQKFESKTIPAGSYNFTPNDVATVGMPNLLSVPATMSNDLAYNIARALWEQRDFLKSMHPIFKRNLNKKVIAKSHEKYGDVAHPGSMKFWKELGAIK